MLFFSTKSRLYQTVASVRPLFRYASTLLILIFIWYVWQQLFYVPISHAIVTQKRELVRLCENRDHVADLVKTCAKKEALRDSLTKKIRTHMQGTTSTDVVNALLHDRLKEIDRAHLELVSYTVGSVTPHDWYAQCPVSCAVEARDYQSIQAFLKAQSRVPFLYDALSLTVHDEKIIVHVTMSCLHFVQKV